MWKIALQLACPLALVFALACAGAGTAHAQTSSASLVADSGRADTLDAGRLQVGVFEPLRYGLSDRVELFTQPLMLALMPQLGAQVRWHSTRSQTLSTRHRLSYPKPLLDTLAKEGSFGLLPATSHVPTAVLIDLDALYTSRVTPSHWLTAFAGISVAPRGSTRDMPLLDFPFLYARFAVLKTTAVARWGVRYHGHFGPRLRVSADLQSFVLPVIYGGFSLEPSLTARVLVSTHVALEAGARLEYARYPAGTQFHYLPFVDVVCAW